MVDQSMLEFGRARSRPGRTRCPRSRRGLAGALAIKQLVELTFEFATRHGEALSGRKSFFNT